MKHDDMSVDLVLSIFAPSVVRVQMAVYLFGCYLEKRELEKE